MKIYEHFGSRLDYRGQVYGAGERINLDESEAAALIANDIPIRPLADEPATPEEVNDVPDTV